MENNCAYRVAAHSTIALRIGVQADIVQALRTGKPLPDNELEAVRRLTRSIVADRGWVDEEEIDVFLAAGYTRRNVLDRTSHGATANHSPRGGSSGPDAGARRGRRASTCRRARCAIWRTVAGILPTAAAISS